MVGGGGSSTVFPIFDGFRAVCAWYPFLILIIIALSYLCSIKIFATLAFVSFISLCVINLNSDQSVYKMISAYKLSYVKLQLVDFTKYSELKKYNEEIYNDGPSGAMTRKFTKAEVGPSLSYDSYYEAISENCNEKKFLSYLPDFYLYFLKKDFQNQLAHKLFMGGFAKDNNGNDLDHFSLLYPDYFKIIQSEQNLCFLLPKDTPSYFIDGIGAFKKVIVLEGSKLYIR
jgi:hypothetical protein